MVYGPQITALKLAKLLNYCHTTVNTTLSINSSIAQSNCEKTPKYSSVTEQQFSNSLSVNKVNIKFPITERLQDRVI